MWWPFKTKTILTALPKYATVKSFSYELCDREYFIAYVHDEELKCSQVTEACYERETFLWNYLNKSDDEKAIDQNEIGNLRLQIKREQDENKQLKAKFTKYVNWVMSRPNAGDEIPF